MSSTLSYGLTPGGFNRMRLPEIRRAIFDDLRRRTGLTFDETPDSLTGQFVAVFAEREAAVWELAEAVHLSAYPATASGIALDLAVGFSGVTRIQPTRSTVTAILFGTQGTLVETGAAIESTELPEGASRPPRFILTADVMITREAAVNALLRVTEPVVEGETYSVTYNGTVLSYVAAAGDAGTQIAAALTSRLTAIGATAGAGAGTVRVTSRTPFSIIPSANITFAEIGSHGVFAGEEVGPIEAPAYSLTRIITPQPGWRSVTNVLPATPGSVLETDDELRARYKTGVFRLGAGTVPSIRANLLQEVPGITSASVYENATDSTDGDGRPPHSVEAVIEGGDADTIAALIYRVKPAGITSYGTTTRQFTDDTGFTHSISFSRPAARNVWLRAVLTTTTEEPVPGDVAARAQAALVAAGNALQVGEDVFLQRLAAAVFEATSGVARVDLTAVVSTSTPAAGAYTTADIPVGPRQRARFALERTQVT